MFKRVISQLMVLCLMTMPILADSPSVTVRVANDTFAEGLWTGTLFETTVEFTEGYNIMDALDAAFEQQGKSLEAEYGFISTVHGLSGEAMGSGWIIMLNDWMPNDSATNFMLEDGDVISLLFSNSGFGADLGAVYGDNDKSIKAMEFDNGRLFPEFHKDTHDYILELPYNVDFIKITPSASNKNFQVFASLDDVLYKRTKQLPIQDGSVVSVICGRVDWPTMNNGEFGSDAESVEPHVYNITIKKSRAWVDDVQLNGDNTQVENVSLTMTGDEVILVAAAYDAGRLVDVDRVICEQSGDFPVDLTLTNSETVVKIFLFDSLEIISPAGFVFQK